ncbi:S9 family peptidase [Conexibacter arvalis]|uniref:Acyl-peptide hydrolase n=1 Tax=Conexibacter arvalis TaxID=912552 RepID=A0A840IMA3_9ACTN|nr:S9 family peptidase [Conexibacter arvalis]MBB4665124.1 dipeptidyl aminopeptidase/acylaminoacyl peptidase [Conexibacter arvalis]
MSIPARPLAPADALRIPRPKEPACSPDGRLIAFTVQLPDAEADTVRARVWAAPADGATPARPLTAGPHDGAPRFSPDGALLAWLASPTLEDEGAGAGVELWAVATDAVADALAAGGERDGREAPAAEAPGAGSADRAALTAGPGAALADEPPAGARRVGLLPAGAGEPAFSPDGTRIAFTAPVDRAGAAPDERAAARRQVAPVVVRRLDEKADGLGLRGTVRRQLHVVDLPSGAVRQLTHDEHDAREPAWSADGRRLVYARALDGDGGAHERSALFEVPDDGGAPRRLTPADGLAAAPCPLPDGGTIAYVGRVPAGLGTLRLLAVDRDGAPPRDLDPSLDRSLNVGNVVEGGCRPQALADGRVLFAVADRGSTHLRAAPLDGGGSEPLLADPLRVAFRAAAGGPTVAVVIADAGSPGELHALPLPAAGAPAADAGRRLTSLFADALPEVAVAPLRERTFTAPDGAEVHGWLLLDEAAGDGPRPLLVDVHGGPHSQWSPALEPARSYWHELVADGWAVLLLNQRASDGYGEAWMTSTVGRWGLADEGDFHAAIDALVAEGIADPRRLAVTGYSYGGYMTCWLTARSRRFRAAVAGGCVADLRSHLGTADIGPSWGRMVHGLAPDGPLAPLEEISPIAHVGAVATPTLVLHGEGDDRCPIGQAEQWFTTLRAQGVESELVRYPDSDHVFVIAGRPSHRVDYCRRTLAWLRAHVGHGAEGGGRAGGGERAEGGDPTARGERAEGAA